MVHDSSGVHGDCERQSFPSACMLPKGFQTVSDTVSGRNVVEWGISIKRLVAHVGGEDQSAVAHRGLARQAATM